VLAIRKGTSMMRPGIGRQRVRWAYVEALAERLTDRDWQIIATLDRVRLATGLQLERLHFNDLGTRSRSVMRWRVLKRLVDARVLLPLDRRVGTARRGSSKLVYVLDSAGSRLARMHVASDSPEGLQRRPRVPGERFVAHGLAVTELYVILVEHARLGRFTLDDYMVEAAAYWPDGLGGWMKPDALVQLHGTDVTDYWWYEADLATESLPTIRSKLLTYLDFVQRGQLGPDGVVPRVLIGVPAGKRQAAIQSVISTLPAPAEVMFTVTLMPDVVTVMARELMK
jgi:hypothetical protein